MPLFAAVCHEIVSNDIPELAEIIGSHGSAKLWCSYLRISDGKCNGLDYSQQHPDHANLDVAKAYYNEIVPSCWEFIVQILCKNLKKNKPAEDLSKEHGVNFSLICRR